MRFKNQLIKLIRNPIARALLIAASIYIFACAGLKLYLVYRFPEKEIKNFATRFIKENFNKAVRFDDISMSLYGDIIITNFHISISSDFNDNISLIKTGRARVSLDLFALFKGDMIIKGMYLDAPEINLVKKFCVRIF